MNIKSLNTNKYLRVIIFVLIGFFAGWVAFHRSPNVKPAETSEIKKPATIWTCSMHPQIRKDEPGLCPLCAMDLIPLTQDATQIDPNTISMTEDAARIAEIQTTTVSAGQAQKEVRLYGQIQADERLVQTQTAHIGGRIEQLLVNFTGEEVRKGQPVAQIYSPSLITAQQELLEALKMNDANLIHAAREKLIQWKLTGQQISDIEKTGQVKSNFDINATVSGIVTARKVNKGDYVQQGSTLFEIADLSHVWALFDAYETDIPWIKKGDKISFALQSLPGQEFTGSVAFIDPVIDAGNRIARIRVEVANRGGNLKPGMFATGNLKASLASKGNSITIPHSSVLWTGTRSIVYIKVPDAARPTFIMRDITRGPDLGDCSVDMDGLEEDEEIVTNGTFNIDASAQLLGKPSMMNGSGEAANGQTSTKKVEAMPELLTQLENLYTAYEDLKNAFVLSDPKKASASAVKLADGLKSVDSKLIGTSEMSTWQEFSSAVDLETKKIIQNIEIEKQRESFSPLSNNFYKIIKMYGSGKTVYYQYCPMAFDNKGAYWLSEKKNIANPYFGDAMLTCGETKEVLR